MREKNSNAGRNRFNKEDNRRTSSGEGKRKRSINEQTSFSKGPKRPESGKDGFFSSDERKRKGPDERSFRSDGDSGQRKAYPKKRSSQEGTETRFSRGDKASGPAYRKRSEGRDSGFSEKKSSDFKHKSPGKFNREDRGNRASGESRGFDGPTDRNRFAGDSDKRRKRPFSEDADKRRTRPFSDDSDTRRRTRSSSDDADKRRTRPFSDDSDTRRRTRSSSDEADKRRTRSFSADSDSRRKAYPSSSTDDSTGSKKRIRKDEFPENRRTDRETGSDPRTGRSRASAGSYSRSPEERKGPARRKSGSDEGDEWGERHTPPGRMPLGEEDFRSWDGEAIRFDDEQTERRPSQRKKAERRTDDPDKSRTRKPISARSKKKPSEPTASADGSIRLNRYLAHAGVASRREADELIAAGSVKINGKVVDQMGARVYPGDRVEYGGQGLKPEKHVYLLLNKPKDFITTLDDPENRKTVMSLVAGACRERIYPVGRLDRNTTGLLLFTNDGDLAKKLSHPSSNIEKMYHVVLDKPLAKADKDKIAAGIRLDDGLVKVDQIEYVSDEGSKRELGVVLHSGKNRVVRRIFESLEYQVEKLDRVSFAGLTKKDLPRGRYRFLNEKEVSFLKTR